MISQHHFHPGHAQVGDTKLLVDRVYSRISQFILILALHSLQVTHLK